MARAEYGAHRPREAVPAAHGVVVPVAKLHGEAHLPLLVHCRPCPCAVLRCHLAPLRTSDDGPPRSMPHCTERVLATRCRRARHAARGSAEVCWARASGRRRSPHGGATAACRSSSRPTRRLSLTSMAPSLRHLVAHLLDVAVAVHGHELHVVHAHRCAACPPASEAQAALRILGRVSAGRNGNAAEVLQLNDAGARAARSASPPRGDKPVVVPDDGPHAHALGVVVAWQAAPAAGTSARRSSSLRQ